MLFLNTVLLLGALGILIPIVIHLLNRRSNRVIDWGAMSFLFESLALRNRRIQLEEALLMASRCLLVGLLALALARPFVPPGSNVPWIVILPLLLIGVVGLGVAVVLHNEPKWRFWIALASVLLLLGCAALVVFEKYLNLSRFGPGGRQDIALIIDGSTSMSLEVDGMSNFERAVEEARTLIKRAPRGHAFSLILGGPSPSARILDPTTDRAELEAALDDLAPLDGAMASYHSLTLASLGLARGANPAKQIILLTDGQSVGWETGKPARWNFLRDTFKNLPTEPQIILRRMPMPRDVRNLAITGVEFSRDIVGTDRPVEIAVRVENTGSEAVTPKRLELRLPGGLVLRDRSMGQVQPGGSETITFSHQFTEPGAHSVEVALVVEDEIPQDNSAAAALNIAGHLKVLIADGRDSARFFERAGTFAALALAPSSRTLNPRLPAAAVPNDPESDDAEAYDPTTELIEFLVEPRLISAGGLPAVPDFEEYDVVILADVSRLPDAATEKLRSFVQGGGGLLVAPGLKAEPDFYNNWSMGDGEPFLPARLGQQLKIAGEEELVNFSPQSLIHPAIRKASGGGKGDLGTVSFAAWWPLEIPDALAADAAVGVRLNTGDPWLVTRRLDAGAITVLGGPLDTTAGNFVTRQVFLPFLHELVYQLANPSAYDLNLDPGWDLTLSLTSGSQVPVGEGLRAEYYRSHDEKAQPAATRIDPAIQFDWGGGAPAPDVPADGFRVEWSGKLRAPETSSYTFDADADDEFELWIDGRSVLKAGYANRGRGRAVKLQAGRWYDLRARLREGGGDAKAILYWKHRKMPRQIIPPDRFRVFAGPAPAAEDGTLQNSLARYSVIGPDNRPRRAELTSTERGSLVKVHGDVTSGLYQLEIPEEQRVYFGEFLREGQETIPFTVKRDPEESRLQRLSDADFTFLSNFVTLTRPETLDDVVSILNGNQFGEELWKYLAVGAFLFLLVEIALSRWIALSRRTGEEIKIEFESRDAPTTGFQQQLERLRAGASRT